jgi:hypothetical protein
MVVKLNRASRVKVARDLNPGEHLRLWVAGPVLRVEDGTAVVEVVDSAEDPRAGVCSECWSVI